MESKRIATILKARFKARGKLWEGKIRNLSLGGLFIGTRSIPPQGESVDVRFRLPNGRSVDVSGFVWWTTREDTGHRHRAPGFGLRLIAADPEYQKAVRQMIQAASARI